MLDTFVTMSGTNCSQNTSNEKYAESIMNLTLLDPPKWGWTAAGGVADLLPPHERARRRESKRLFVKGKKRKRGRPSSSNNASLKQPPQFGSNLGQRTGNKDEQAEESKKEENEQDNTASEIGRECKPQPPQGSESLEVQKEPPTATNDSSRNPLEKTGNVNLQNDVEGSKAPDKETEKSVAGQIDSGQPGDVAEKNEEVQQPREDPTAAGGAHSETPQGATKAQLQSAQLEGVLQQETEQEKAKTAMREPNKYSEGSKPNDKVLDVNALREDGSLDLYAYHRGREGMEPRDENTGELLCDVEMTDSNWKLDEPKLSTQIKIKFPLSDDKDIPESEIPMYEDTIFWDLGDAETPSPMVFAADVAENFGLTFGQTMDLAESVQRQLYDFIRENCGYSVPLAMTDGSGVERTNFAPPTYSRLYGDVYNQRAEGMICGITRHPSKSKSKGKAFGPSAATTSRRSDPSIEELRLIRSGEQDEPVEEKYVLEVRKRMEAFSRDDVDAKSRYKPGPQGAIQMKQNHVCHICHKRHDVVGEFPCDITSHSYCKMHLQNRCGISVESINDTVTIDACPICSLSCLCKKCERRRDALAMHLKALCKEQGVEPADVVYEDMFRCFSKPASVARIQKSNVAARRRDSVESTVAAEDTKNWTDQSPPKKKTKLNRRPSSLGEEQKLNVPKANPSDFPREVRNGVHVDSGTATDYLTVFTAEGSYVQEPPAIKPRRNLNQGTEPMGTDVVEDGNVDYCHKCRKHGNLICCDYCPRAFHQRCIEGDAKETGGTFRCHVCLREQGDLPEDELTGSDSMPTICAAYSSLKPTRDADLMQLHILSKLHEMVLKLMSYDFGYIFCEPVDCKQVLGYKDLIKKPMDLGTIGKRLVNGYYKKFYETHKSWDDVHIAVLKDIELVWHNCFTFNLEGSSIHRMAEVHRKRMLKMLARSINDDLSENVKQEIRDYVAACQRERGKISSTDGGPNTSKPALARPDVRPMSKYKITIKNLKSGLNKPVAVFNPDTGMIVKVYSTLKSAFLAAEFVRDRGNSSELSQISEHSIKTLVHRSAEDPDLTLFGYRWLVLNKLRDRQVKFSKPSDSKAEKSRAPRSPVQVFLMTHEDCTYIFLSVDEALSFPRLPKELSVQELREMLVALSEEGQALSLNGVTWRRLKPPRSSFVDKRNESMSEEEKSVFLAPFWRSGKENIPAKFSSYLPENAFILKEDMICRRVLASFSSLSAAFEDWRDTCKSSPTIAEDEITMPNFHNYFLDGDRNVDGVMWKTVESNSDAVSDANAKQAGIASHDTDAPDVTIDAEENEGSKVEKSSEYLSHDVMSSKSVPGGPSKHIES